MNVYIETSGCSLNHADSETMMGALQRAGHTLVEAESEADVVLYNTCTVKDPSQDRFLSQLERQEKPVVVAGCIPQADQQGLLDGYVQLGTQQLQQAPSAVEAAASGQQLQLLDPSEDARLDQPKVRVNEHVEIVPICKGCLSNCTYCKTKQARGALESYRPMAIEQEVRRAVRDGVKEVWLTSQDNGAYGMDIGTNPGALLERIARIEGDFRIRFGMTNPDWTLKWLDELVRAFKHEKVYDFLHLPVQSGSDDVLAHMRRRCTTDDIREIVNTFREEIPGITVATDIICGYPTETEEDFEETLELVKELRFPVINISKFYPRPDTRAAAMDKHPTKTVKARSTRLTRLFESEPWQAQHADKQGTTVRALFTDRKGDSNLGRTQNYTQVVVNSEKDLRGTWQDVKVEETTRDDLRGRIN